MAYTVAALTFGLLAFGVADACAAQQGNCNLSVGDVVKVGKLTTSELTLLSLSTRITADNEGPDCFGTFKLTDSGQGCVNRLSDIYGADAPGLQQDGTSTNEILTALNGVRLVEPIVILMSDQEGRLVVDGIDGLQIQFNWKYKKIEDRVRVVGELVLEADEQLKSLCSH